MRVRQFASVGLLLVCAAGGTRAQQPGVGQSPSGLPLTVPIRERGSSVTPAFEGWYFDKDGSQRVMVGYFNRNTKQEFDIPAGPNNRIEPGGPIWDSRRISIAGAVRVFSITPESRGRACTRAKRYTWSLTQTARRSRSRSGSMARNVSPFFRADNGNSPPVAKLDATGRDSPVRRKNREDVDGNRREPLTLTWATDTGTRFRSRPAHAGSG
jgi:hypothetical protein